MQPISPQECSRIAQDLQLRKVQVENVVQLIDDGNTVPFIARYRKDRTTGLHEEAVRQVQQRVSSIRQLHDRKQTILKSIEHHGKLTEELRQAVLGADTLRRLEDLYLPFKPKKRTPASTARERGLEAAALAIWHSDPAVGNLDELLPSLVNPDKELKSAEDVRTGIGQIVAEMIAESAEVRAPVRAMLWEMGKLTAAKNEKLGEGQGLDYKDYFQFNESTRHIPPHRILALNRGEKEGVLKIHLDFPREKVQGAALHALAELLLKKANQPVPPPSVVPPPPATIQAAPAPSEPGTPPPADAAPAVGQDSAPVQPEGQAPTAVPPENSAAPEVAGEATPPGVPVPTAELTDQTAPVADAVPTATPAPPSESAAAPLVANMEPRPPVTLTGEPLAPPVEFRSPHVAFLKAVLEDALTRILFPALEREIRRELTDEAEGHAVGVFARNLRSLLLQPPLRGKRVLAVDPGFRTSSKLAALDEAGNLLGHAIIHPFNLPPRRRDRHGPKDTAKEAAAPAASGAPAAPPPAVASSDVPVIAAPAPGEPGAVSPFQATEPPAVAASAPAAPEIGAQPSSTDTPAASDTPATTEAGAPSAAPVSESTAATAPQPAPPPPAPTVDKKAEARQQLKDLINKHQVHVVALGNGAGCRELEELIADLIASDLPDLSYVIVNEAGANVYAISQVGREEFPTHDATLRSAISIGRRLQDPLNELVKVDPQNIGVGLYQHDMNRKELRESLEGVVESCVNHVGVDLNTASVPFLRHVSGLNQMVARELVAWRKQHGAFASREQLLQLTSLAPQRWMQAVGFLKISGATHPLDRTWIHPESYGHAEKILAAVGATSSTLNDASALTELRTKLAALNVGEMSRTLELSPGTTQDLIEALLRPDFDPRDELPPPVFKKKILQIEDLQAGMELKGTVQNVVDFGAFVDIGLKESGLVHISQMANRYIRSPYEVVAVNDVVSVWVHTVDKERHRVSLTMIAPGTERPPQERRPQRQGERGRPRGDRPGGPPPGQGGRPPQPGQEQGGAGEGRGQQRPPRGRHRGRGHGRPPQGAPGQGAPAHAGAQGTGSESARSGPPQQRPPLPPRRPRREPPKPKLTQAALEGKVPLRTFSELSALFAAKKEKEVPPPPAPPVVAEVPAAPAPPEPTPAPVAEAVAAPAAEPPATSSEGERQSL